MSRALRLRYYLVDPSCVTRCAGAAQPGPEWDMTAPFRLSLTVRASSQAGPGARAAQGPTDRSRKKQRPRWHPRGERELAEPRGLLGGRAGPAELHGGHGDAELQGGGRGDGDGH